MSIFSRLFKKRESPKSSDNFKVVLKTKKKLLRKSLYMPLILIIRIFQFNLTYTKKSSILYST